MALSYGVEVAIPILPAGLGKQARNAVQAKFLQQVLAGQTPAVAWYYTPMALGYSRQIQAGVTVYDNMDELSLFHGADSRMLLLEKELMAAQT